MTCVTKVILRALAEGRSGGGVVGDVWRWEGDMSRVLYFMRGGWCLVHKWRARRGPAGGLILRPPRYLHPVSSSWARNFPPKLCAVHLWHASIEALHQRGETISRATSKTSPRLSPVDTSATAAPLQRTPSSTWGSWPEKPPGRDPRCQWNNTAESPKTFEAVAPVSLRRWHAARAGDGRRCLVPGGRWEQNVLRLTCACV